MTRPVDQIFPEAERPQSIAANLCVKPPFGCGKAVTGFNDPLSEREYKISGLCQACQDEVFGSDGDDDLDLDMGLPPDEGAIVITDWSSSWVDEWKIDIPSWIERR